jgi:integrase
MTRPEGSRKGPIIGVPSTTPAYPGYPHKHVLGRELEWLDDVVRAKRPERLPVVLTRQEVEALLAVLDGVSWLMAMVLYGSGVRVTECLQLRVKAIDFTRHEVLVREGKGDKDRVTMLSTAVAPDLKAHLERGRTLHSADLAAGLGRVSLPHALARKYPNANREFGWQWVFPASRICTDPRFGPPQRYHLHKTVPERAIHEAARKAGILKPVSPRTLRHYSASRTMPSDLGINCAEAENTG